MKAIVLAAATVALTTPAFAQTLSQTSGVLAIAPTASTVTGTSATSAFAVGTQSAASGSLSVSAKSGVSALLTIAAATNSSSGTK